jgi:ribosomal protein S18 acetylase RimI-like enzyme
MIRANRKDKLRVVQLLGASFINNQSVNYIVRQDHKRKKRIVALMDYSFEICHRFGEVWLSEDRVGAALILYPQLKHTNLQSIWLDIKLISTAIGIGRVFRALRRESQIQAKHPKGPVAYLWFIGIDPGAQRQGIGTRLLQELIIRSEQEYLPLLLETSTVTNLPWYQQFGFNIYDQVEFGYQLYFLKRVPD